MQYNGRCLSMASTPDPTPHLTQSTSCQSQSLQPITWLTLTNMLQARRRIVQLDLTITKGLSSLSQNSNYLCVQHKTKNSSHKIDTLQQ